MLHINELMQTLPIDCGDKELNILTFNNMEWYIENCKKQYYEEFLDFKFSSDIEDYKLREVIYNMIVSYKLGINSKCEARLLLIDKKNKVIYGGCTLFENEKYEHIEIAYFVLPEYQRAGLGTTILKNVTKTLKESEIPFKKLKITVREDNLASLKLAEKIGFKYVKDIQGKYKNNKIMAINREAIK